MKDKVLIYSGKTKDVYDLGGGVYQLYFRDEMTGEDGVFDPGSNSVGLTMEGAGIAGLGMSSYYFKLLNEKGCATHFIESDVSARTMNIKPVTRFGEGLEIVCRYVAMGSFVKRYGSIVKSGAALPAVVEVTLKDDERGDPLINKECLEALGILKPDEYEVLVGLTKRICGIIRDDLAEKGLELCDIKLEFGRDSHGVVMLIDEISAGNMRVRKDGEIVPPLELARLVV
jgi:phosphoribosylaminoimidazole-succinocarboxamide synthase